MMSDKYSIKWNEFGTNVSKSFHLSKNEDYLCDVTIVTDDFMKVSAHKFVLASSSEYFKNIFKATRQAQPILCLDEVNSLDLQNVLDYVYNGEVSILQENLEKFMEVGKKLKLEGLAGGVKRDMGSFIDEEAIPEQNSFVQKCKAEKEKKEQRQEVSSPIQSSESGMNFIQEFYTGDIDNDSFNVKLKAEDNMILNSDGTWTCQLCNKVLSWKNPKDKSEVLKAHMDSHGVFYRCPFPRCEKAFRALNYMRAHMTKIHKRH